MKTLKLLFTLVAFIGVVSSTYAQKKKKQIITEVEFTTDKIILNNKHAFDYVKDRNYFEIKNLQGETLITGQIKSTDEKTFTSIINFLTLKEQFSNKKIVGRNELIFALCENNVITKDFKLDNDKLELFIKDYNELEEDATIEN